MRRSGRTAPAAVHCISTTTPPHHPEKASTQPLSYDNADTLASPPTTRRSASEPDDDEAFSKFVQRKKRTRTRWSTSPTMSVGATSTRRTARPPVLFEDREAFEKMVTLSSKLGSPSTYDYNEWGNVSPTQLRSACVRGAANASAARRQKNCRNRRRLRRPGPGLLAVSRPRRTIGCWICE